MGAAKSSEELKALKEHAKAMGISFSPNIGLQALKDKIAKVENSEGLTEESLEPEKKELTEHQKEVQNTLNGMKKASKLHRIMVHCLNPDKSDLKYDMIQVGNTKYGFIGRVLPFNKPWHVEEIIYNYLKNKKYYKVTSRKEKEGGVYVIKIDKELVNEYDVQDLPPLTPEELSNLALDQSASGRIRDDLAN